MELSSEPIIIRTDSDNAAALIEGNAYKESNKWLQIRHHFVQDAFQKGLIKVEVIASEDNPADALTKALTVDKFVHCRELTVLQKC
ncbi:hypothetical protein N7454_010850 [Penicillium verhagenii]|nr:hypothetical protein N7454_010850 [Penicillium verhagenii]